MERRPPYPSLALSLLLATHTSHAQPEPPAAAEPAPAAAAADAPPPTPTPATPEPKPLPPSPLINLHVAEPAPVVERTYRRHDGFYFRSNVGFLLGSMPVSSDSPAHPGYRASGLGIELDVLVGGTPSVGLALGGGLSLQSIGTGSSSSGGLLLVGPFVDGFPMPNRGFHVGGLLGFAASRTQRSSGVDELEGRGFGMATWIGDDFWVADDWSVGGMLRLTGAVTRDASADKGPAPYTLESSTYAVSLLFTVLCH